MASAEFARRAARGVAATLGRGLAALSPRRRAVVLCYHAIDAALPYASASPALFREHLAWLRAHCEIVDLDDLHVAGGERPRVAITFDDGYADNHEHAAPLLAEAGARATFFLTAGFLARDPAVLARFTFLRSGASTTPLSWAQARELRAAGHAIGAHTWSHPVLASLPPDEQARELERSKRELEDRIGDRIDRLAYPFGKPRRHFSSETIAAARGAGYRGATAVAFRAVRPHDDPFAVPRFFVSYDSVERLAAKVRGDYDALGWWHERAPRWLARLASPQDFAWDVAPCA